MVNVLGLQAIVYEFDIYWGAYISGMVQHFDKFSKLVGAQCIW